MKRLVALLLLVVLGASACAYGGTPQTPAALTIDSDVVVSVEQLEAELEYLRENEDVAAALLTDPATGAPVRLEGEVPGAFSPAAAALILNQHANADIVERVAAELGVTPDQGSFDEARSELTQQAADAGVDLSTMPEGLIDLLVARSVALDAIATWLQENPLEPPEVTDEDLEAWFEANRATLPEEVACVRHVLVAFPTDPEAEPGQPTEPTAEDDAATRAEIDAVVARLAAGEDFGAVAEEVSDDPGSAAAGGDLGCGDPALYVEEFAAAVVEQPVGEVGEPVRTQFGWHVLEVTYRGEPTIEQFEVQARSELSQVDDDQTRYQELYLAAAESVDVRVDPRFGRWVPERGGVVAPEGAADPPAIPADPFDGIDFPVDAPTG